MTPKLFELHELFKELSGKGLIGISEDYIQVDNELFKKIADAENIKTKLENTEKGIRIELESYIYNKSKEEKILICTLL